MKYPLRIIFVFTLLLPLQALGAIAYRAFSEASDADGGAITVTAGTSANRTGCGSITPSIPAGTIGDLLVAQVVARQDGDTVTMPGWTTFFSYTTAGNNYKAYMFYRTATSAAANGDARTITQSGTCNLLFGEITRFGNVDPGQPLEPFSAGNAVFSTDGNVDSGTQTVNVVNSMLVLATFVGDNRNVAQPGTFTELFDIITGTGTDGGLSLNYRFETTTGSKGAFTNMDLSGAGNDPSHGLLFVVRPQGLTLTVPAGTVDDDVMVAGITFRPCSNTNGGACTVTITAPTGWTQSTPTGNQTGGAGTDGYGNRLYVYYKVANSEPASYTWNIEGTPDHAGAAGGIISFSGVDTTSPIVVSGGQATAASYTHAAPSIDTGTVTNTMLISTHSVNSAGSWTPPGGMTERVEIASLPLTDNLGLSIEMNHEARAAAGATGTRTATLSNPPANDTGATHMLALRPASQIDHFSINIGGASGSTCNAKSITITAQDASNATVTDYTGTVNITTSTSHGDWAQASATGTLNNGTADDGAASYTFVAGDNGVKILNLTNVHADDLTITVVDSTLSSTSTTSSTINFRDNVFVITNDTLQIAGRNQSMTVEMWRRDTTTGNCSIATGYTGAKNLDAWLTLDTQHPTGATVPTIGALSLPTTAPAVNPASNNLALTFTSGSASFNLGTTDVGKYVLNMRDDTRGFAGAVDISGSSSSITTRPFALVISGVTQGTLPAPVTNPSGSASGDSLFGIAGIDFNTTVGAYRYSATADTNNDGAVDAAATLAETTAGGLAPRYNTALTLTRSPLGFTPAGGTVGTLSNATFNTFTNGAQTRSDLQYSEVGSFLFDTSSSLVTNYLGTSGVNLSGTYFNSSDSQTNATRVGRFRPNDFAISLPTITNRVDAGCGVNPSFSYMGEMLRLEFTLTARNGQGSTTVNYTTASGFAKLDPTDITTLGIDAIDSVVPTPLSGRIPASPTISSTGSSSFTNGAASVLARVMVNRGANPEAPLTNVQWGMVPTESDGVSVTLNLNTDNSGGNDHGLITSSVLRYGRLFMENAFGSELLPLTIPLRAEYATSATQFALNTLDNCTTYNSAGVPDLPTLPFANRVNLTSDPTRSGMGTLVSGRYDPLNPFQLTTVSTPLPQIRDGSIDAILDVPTYLRFDWRTDGSLDGINDDYPFSKATFGIYGGPEDNQIYIREVY